MRFLVEHLSFKPSELEKIPKYSPLGSQVRTFVEYLYYFLTFHQFKSYSINESMNLEDMLFRSEQQDAAKRLMKAENLKAESLGIDISSNYNLQIVSLLKEEKF